MQRCSQYGDSTVVHNTVTVCTVVHNTVTVCTELKGNLFPWFASISVYVENHFDVSHSKSDVYQSVGNHIINRKSVHISSLHTLATFWLGWGGWEVLCRCEQRQFIEKSEGGEGDTQWTCGRNNIICFYERWYFCSVLQYVFTYGFSSHLSFDEVNLLLA